LKIAVVSKGVPSDIAERITDLLAGFSLARSIVGPESGAARMWLRRAGKWLGRRKARKSFPNTSDAVYKCLCIDCI